MIHKPTRINKKLPVIFDALKIEEKCWKIHE